jgi:hypothetical protein
MRKKRSNLPSINHISLQISKKKLNNDSEEPSSKIKNIIINKYVMLKTFSVRFNTLSFANHAP